MNDFTKEWQTFFKSEIEKGPDRLEWLYDTTREQRNQLINFQLTRVEYNRQTNHLSLFTHHTNTIYSVIEFSYYEELGIYALFDNHQFPLKMQRLIDRAINRFENLSTLLKI